MLQRIQTIRTPENLRALVAAFRRYRGAEDVAVGFGTALWPVEYTIAPALFAGVDAESGLFSAVAEGTEELFLPVRRWAMEDDGDRMALFPNYSESLCVWVETLSFAEQRTALEAMRKRISPEELGSIQGHIAAQRQKARTQGFQTLYRDQPYWSQPFQRFQVALQLIGIPGDFTPVTWLVEDEAGMPYLFWSGQAEETRALFNDWYAPQLGTQGFVSRLVESPEEETQSYWSRTRLLTQRARTPNEAAEQLMRRHLQRTGLAV